MYISIQQYYKPISASLSRECYANLRERRI